MNNRRRLTIMKSQLIIMFDEAIANYDKAIARQNTTEWEEYADEYDLSMWELEEGLTCSINEIDKLVDAINCECSAFEDAAEKPFEEFI